MFSIACAVWSARGSRLCSCVPVTTGTVPSSLGPNLLALQHATPSAFSRRFPIVNHVCSLTTEPPALTPVLQFLPHLGISLPEMLTNKIQVVFEET